MEKACLEDAKKQVSQGDIILLSQTEQATRSGRSYESSLYDL
jgi:hypothetical protein